MTDPTTTDLLRALVAAWDDFGNDAAGPWERRMDDLVEQARAHLEPTLDEGASPMSDGGCRDRDCSPERGEDGCTACIVNAGAVDALDFVWTRAWDDCPVINAQQSDFDAYEHVQRQEDEWLARQERAAEAGGAFR